jgi:hypothetical protein
MLKGFDYLRTDKGIHCLVPTYQPPLYKELLAASGLAHAFDTFLSIVSRQCTCWLESGHGW